MNIAKYEFLENQIFSMTLMATTQRGKVYHTDASEEGKATFRHDIRFELRRIADKYKTAVAEERHIANIEGLSDQISQAHSNILTQGRFRIGSAQKAINLYLKYLWCLDKIPTPPHCPFDAIVLSYVPNCKTVRWTQLDSLSEYREIVRLAKIAAEGKSLSDWELNLYNIYGVAQSGKDRLLTGPPHTTRHAGPHRAVHQQGAHDFSHA
jgi:hypothetical protein